MITVGILRCNVCGAPMYPNPAKQAFCCPFCGNVSAYGMQQSRMKHETNTENWNLRKKAISV